MTSKYYKLTGGVLSFNYEIIDPEGGPSTVGFVNITINDMQVCCNNDDNILSIYWYSNHLIPPFNNASNEYNQDDKFTLAEGFSSIINISDWLNNFFNSEELTPSFYAEYISLSGKNITDITPNTSGDEINILDRTAVSPFSITTTNVPSCFGSSTRILCLNKQLVDEYISIQMLEIGDLVKTYKHGYRRITHIAKNAFFNNPDNFQECMYIMKKHDDMMDDLVVTGYHAILVDNPDREELDKQAKYGITEKIDDKYLIISSVSELFEKDMSRDFHMYYHFSLESD